MSRKLVGPSEAAERPGESLGTAPGAALRSGADRLLEWRCYAVAHHLPLDRLCNGKLASTSTPPSPSLHTAPTEAGSRPDGDRVLFAAFPRMVIPGSNLWDNSD